MEREFDGKIVVVTGGSRGIGRAIAAAFAGAGAQTVIAASSEKNLASAAEIIAKKGGPATLTCTGDLKQLENCEALFDLVVSRFGRCDVLVNSAGATKAGDFLELIDEDWQDGFALKFLAAVRLCRLFWPLLKATGGHVVNIVGGAARTPDQNFLIGGSVNAALANFSKGLADRGKHDGVQVNCIHPSMVETDRLWRRIKAEMERTGWPEQKAREEMCKGFGITRFGKVDDVADMITFLVSSRATWMHGATVDLDGGEIPTL